MGSGSDGSRFGHWVARSNNPHLDGRLVTDPVELWKDRRRAVLDWIGVQDESELCCKCGGRGHRGYGNTSTWRGGIGGQAVTTDVCDECWGTGVKARTGTNLRKLEAELQRLRQTYCKVCSHERRETLRCYGCGEQVA